MKRIIITLFILFFATEVWSQDFMEIDFNKEIIHNDTCIRFYNVKNFDIKDTNVWENILENFYNIVLITPSKREIGDNDFDGEYYSACDNILFYCIEGSFSNVLLTDEELNNGMLQKRIICIFDYKNGKLIKYR